MFTLTAIWGIGETPCSFKHYLVVSTASNLSVSIHAVMIRKVLVSYMVMCR